MRFSAMSWDVRVVPMFDPKMIPSDVVNEMIPAFTSPTVMTVVAVLDWTREVTMAPTAVLRAGVRVSCWMRFRK